MLRTDESMHADGLVEGQEEEPENEVLRRKSWRRDSNWNWQERSNRFLVGSS
jgi:hypothetical protein